MPWKAKKVAPLEVVRPGDLIPDNRLAPGAEDLLEHDAIARGVAEIAWTADAPVNIALFGSWGSGKSSVYSMIEAHLKRIAPKQYQLARYDAWKYGGRELKRNFIDSLAHELGLEDEPEFSDGLDTEQADTKLNTGPWLVKNRGSLLIGLALAVGVAVLWVLTQSLATVIFTDGTFKATAKSLIAQAGTVFGLALVATLVGPKVFEGAVVTKKTPAPEGADQFAKRFKRLVNAALKKHKAKRLIVFIDELDRCDPKDVVATLIDLKTFLDQDDCVFIVAADREVIERALNDLPQAKPVREDEPYYATPGAFLDKIFQHQLALPPLRSRALTKFAQDLVADQNGIWAELRDHDEVGQDTFDRTVFALVPVHVRSPRRVKVLLNNYATNARIAASRGIDWLDRAHEIAVLTVLATEFPAVAEDLRRVPRLLVYLREEEASTAPEVVNIVNKYIDRAPATTPPIDPDRENTAAQDDAVTEPTDTAAGRLLADDPTATGARERNIASENLRRHLANYLAKVTAAGIRDPRPDLLYLQPATGREDLPEPKLADLIDFATDTAPSTVVEAFATHESATLAIAIPLLVVEGDNAIGPGRKFAYEAACRLIERLYSDDQANVTRQVSPSLGAAISKGELSERSLPGALLTACWADTPTLANEILTGVGPRPDATLLDNLTVALPYLADHESNMLIKMLGDQFGEHPDPLISALQIGTDEDAVATWELIADEVIGALEALEYPTPAPAPAPAATTAAAAGTAQAAPAVPEPSGAGVARLAELVEAITAEGGNEALLSTVLRAVQAPTAAEPLTDWVNENADRLIAPMTSPLRRAHHAVLGLFTLSDEAINTWTNLMPASGLPSGPGLAASLDNPAAAGETSAAADSADAESAPTPAAPSDTDAVVRASAGKLLNRALSVFHNASSSRLTTLSDLIPKIASWTTPTPDDIAATVATALENTGWAGADAEPTGEMIWERKEKLFSLAVPLAPGDTAIHDAFVSDLSEVPGGIPLTAYVADHWQRLVSQLPAPAAQTLSDSLDVYDPPSTEAAAHLSMQIDVRAACERQAPPARALLDLPAAEQTTALTTKWLRLNPDPTDVHETFGHLPYMPDVIRSYFANLNLDTRTSTWLAFLNSNPSDGHLKAAGIAGIGSAAVTDIHNKIKTFTREQDRSRLVEQLRLARPATDDAPAVKKASSELATELLDKGTAGDLRTAAELILWAGGAGYGYKEALRGKFTAQAKKNNKSLPQKTRTSLTQSGLLQLPPEKGLLAKLTGR